MSSSIDTIARASSKEPFFYSYLITDPQFYTNDPIIFEQNILQALDTHKVDIATFRDKSSSNFEHLASIFVNICKKKNTKYILINSDIKLAHKLQATGVHLTSSQFASIKYAKSLGLFVIISCHNDDDIQNAIDNGADMVTYSPIFDTPNKGKALGIEALKSTIKKFDIPIIALGGIITTQHINDIKSTDAAGFASIRYFIS